MSTHSLDDMAKVLNMNETNPTAASGKIPQCPICCKMFRWANEVVIHLRTHTGERPFPCPYCEYRATQRGALKRHLSVKHPVELTQYSSPQWPGGVVNKPDNTSK